MRAEYPEGLTLAEIAYRWGDGLTPLHLAALSSVERFLDPETDVRGVEQSRDVGEEQP